jgi:hypothetical protein
VALTVQNDESLFSKRKYNIGREVRKVWIIGGICYETNEVFFCGNVISNSRSTVKYYFGKC